MLIIINMANIITFILAISILLNTVLAKKDVFGIHSKTFDTAELSIVSSLDEAAQIWGQTDECYNCEIIMLKEVHRASIITLYMDTRYKTKMMVVPIHAALINSTSLSCMIDFHFVENSNYSLFININDDNNNSESITCQFIDPGDIDRSYIPILVAAGIYLTLLLLYVLIRQVYRKQWFYKLCCCLGTSSLVNSDLGAPGQPVNDTISINPTNCKPTTKRLKSLDTFRGISIVIMIFVNFKGGEYWYFQHSRWNGLTVADLVFPWFVFIMGTSITLSQYAMRLKGVSTYKLFLKIVRRTVILFALGLFMNSDGKTNLATLRIPGVLQRFSVSYFVVAFLELMFGRSPQVQYNLITPRWYTPLRDVVEYWMEWLIISVLLVVYICLTFLLPVPGCPTGYLGPGGLLQNGKNGTLFNCTGGAAGIIDKWLFGVDHIYPHPTCKVIYNTGAYDPEGVLGSIPSIFITFLGLQAGKIFLIYPEYKARIKRFFIWALITGVVAIILCNGNKNEGWIPVNKNIWSLSFVLALSSMAFLLLILCYYTIDVLHWWTGSPFYYPGMNSIFLYIGQDVFADYLPFSWQLYHGNHAEYLARSLIGASLWTLIAFYLYRVKFFLKI